MKKSEPKAPAHLSRASKQWWRAIQADYAVADAAGLAVLAQAAESLDRVAAAGKEIRESGIVVQDRWGQTKPHPAAAIERDAKASFLQALRALNLDVEPLHDRPGRPGGR